ncbi:hypothetical protein PRIC2_001440 [Phytophthora ramorum]
MEIAVAASSPLGQYLAELDAENDGTSAAQLLSATRPGPKKRPRRQLPRVSGRWSCERLIALLCRRMELLVVRRLVPQLCDIHPTIREELQQAVGCSDVAVLNQLQCKAEGGQWKRRVVLQELLSGVEVGAADDVRRFVAVIGGGFVAVAAAVMATADNGDVVLLQTMGWVVALVVFALLGLELSARLLLAWYTRRSGRLVASLSEFVDALGKFNHVYGDSLTLVKRAELASRGYRLGTGLLPPIGRLEANNAETSAGDGSEEDTAVFTAQQQLRCVPLRRRLRKFNDQLQIRATAVVQNDAMKIGAESQDTTKEDIVDEQAPSLLLTALAKQRSRAILLLETAVRTVLVRNLARACSSRGDAGNLFRLLGSQRVGVDELVGTLGTWTDELEAWNTTRDPESMFTSVSGVNHSERQQSEQQVVPSTASYPHLKSVATHLQELRSTSETLGALVIAAQHDILPADSAAQRLLSSREVMKTMVQQLQEAWSSYDNAVSVLTVRDDAQGSDVAETETDNGQESKPASLALPSASVPTTEDPDCTVVFTGTSTGDEGFDLQALLNQQEADTASSAAKPHFVRELRDVLAHRQAHAQPGLTKQVDHDPPVSLPPLLAAEHGAPPPPPPADAMFALPRAPPRARPRRPPPASPSLGNHELPGAVANAFNMELRALLQRAQQSQQGDVIECLGESDEETEPGESHARPGSTN